MNIRFFLKTISFLLLLILTCCRSEVIETTTVPSMDNTELPISKTTPPLIVSKEPVASPIPTSTLLSPWFDFSELNPGQHLLIRTEENGKPYLYAYSSSKANIEKILLRDNYIFSASNDGSELLVMNPDQEQYYYLKLSSKEWKELTIKGYCSQASWSADKRYIAVGCTLHDLGEIYILDILHNSIILLTDCLDKQNVCFAPSWSTDGTWLAYYRSDARSGFDTVRGVYLFNTKCIDNGTNCMADQIGPIRSASNPTWTPDNNLVITNEDESSFEFLEFRDGMFQITEKSAKFDALSLPFRISSSPDGKYVAYTSLGSLEVFIYTRSTSQSEILLKHNHYTIGGWILIP